MQIYPDEFIQMPNALSDLRALSIRISSSRMVNLHQLWLDRPRDPEYESRPVFHQPLLNRSIIIKYNPKPGEPEFGLNNRLSVTKLILPLDVNNLGLGGQFLVASQPDFVERLQRAVDYSSHDFKRDHRMIRILDALPSFDPYLLDQATRHADMRIARCYLRLTKADFEHLNAFITAEMAPLIALVAPPSRFSGPRDNRLISLLLSNEDNAEALKVLGAALRMSKEQFSVALFSWKAILFYKWRMSGLGDRIKRTLTQIRDIRPAKRPSGQMSQALEEARRALLQQGQGLWRDCLGVEQGYDLAYDALIREGKPKGFRDFLLRAPGLCTQLGDELGRLDHLCAYWKSLMDSDIREMMAEELCGVLIDISRGLKPSAAPFDASEADQERLARAS